MNLFFGIKLNADQPKKELKGLNGLFKSLADQSKGSSSVITRSIQGFSSVTAGAYAAIAVGAGMVIKSWVDMASTAEEVENKFNVVFRGVKEASEVIEDLSDKTGYAESSLNKMTSSLGDLIKPAGFSADAAFKMSKTFTQLALDIGSFNDTAPQKVVEDFMSALSGGSETLTKYGIDVRVATIKQEAYKMGLIDSVGAYQHLDAETKRNVRTQVILAKSIKDSKDAIGDLERTSDSYANQSRVFNETLKELGEVAGDIFIPALTSIVSELNIMMKSLKGGLEVTERWTKILGIVWDSVSVYFMATNEEIEKVDNSLSSTFDSVSGLLTSVGAWVESALNAPLRALSKALEYAGEAFAYFGSNEIGAMLQKTAGNIDNIKFSFDSIGDAVELAIEKTSAWADNLEIVKEVKTGIAELDKEKAEEDQKNYELDFEWMNAKKTGLTEIAEITTEKLEPAFVAVGKAMNDVRELIEKGKKDIDKMAENTTKVKLPVIDMRTDFQKFTDSVDKGRGMMQSILSTAREMQELFSKSISEWGFSDFLGLGMSVSGLFTGGGLGTALFSGIQNLGRNATGGDYVIGGQGGIDSQLVMFRGSPGESVSIRPNGQGETINNSPNITFNISGNDMNEDVIKNQILPMIQDSLYFDRSRI